MFELYTEQARYSLLLAQAGARRSRHRQIDTAHLLFGVVRSEDGVSAAALRSAGIDSSDKVRDAIEAVHRPGKHDVVGGVPLTQEAQLSLVRTYRWSVELRNATFFPPDRSEGYVGVEHIFLGLLDKETDTSSRVLRALNQDPQALRERLVKLMAEQELIAQDAVPRLAVMSEAILRGETKMKPPRAPRGKAAVTGGFWSRGGRSRADAGGSRGGGSAN